MLDWFQAHKFYVEHCCHVKHQNIYIYTHTLTQRPQVELLPLCHCRIFFTSCRIDFARFDRSPTPQAGIFVRDGIVVGSSTSFLFLLRTPITRSPFVSFQTGGSIECLEGIAASLSKSREWRGGGKASLMLHAPEFVPYIQINWILHSLPEILSNKFGCCSNSRWHRFSVKSNKYSPAHQQVKYYHSSSLFIVM